MLNISHLLQSWKGTLLSLFLIKQNGHATVAATGMWCINMLHKLLEEKII